jgi:signal transduction histidine kinase
MGAKGGLVHIEVKNIGRRTLICIGDEGSGIAAEAEGKLFMPFFTTKAAGTGLGLAIAKKLVEGMGGKIMLDNRIEKNGALVTIQMVRG